MIQRLKQKHLFDCYDLIKNNKDTEDFYITWNENRIGLNNLQILKKVLKQQEVYGIYDSNLVAIMIIYKEKGYRPYIKLLANNSKYYNHFMIFLRWNIFGELYLKIKKNSPLVKVANQNRWLFKGLRNNNEILFCINNIKRSNYDERYIKD